MRHTTVGVIQHKQEWTANGVTIITPLHSTGVYLVGMKGEVLHQWSTEMSPGLYSRLLPNGNLFWSGRTEEGPNPAGGKGGLIRELDWNGNIVWEHVDNCQHHDFRRLRNGNTLYIGWEKMPKDKASRVKGAEPGSEIDGKFMWGDLLREVNPNGDIIWEWHIHSDCELEKYPLHPMSTRKEMAHCNSCSELPNGDILLSFRRINTLMIIDKKTKKIKWDQRNDSWGGQHDAEMLPNGNVLFFANGIGVPKGIYNSRVLEIKTENGEIDWEYEGSPIWSFFSPNISGCQRLKNGNTIICEGLNGRIFEVTKNKEIVWEFINPWFGDFHPSGPSNAVFRAYRYELGSDELSGRISKCL